MAQFAKSRNRHGCKRLALGFILLTTSGCALLPRFTIGSGAPPRVFRGTQTNSGPERYASWFGDSDGRIL